MGKDLAGDPLCPGLVTGTFVYRLDGVDEVLHSNMAVCFLTLFQ